MTPLDRSGRLVTETVGLAVVGTVVYYVLPVPHRMRTGSWVLLFCVGLGVLGFLILLFIRRLLREGAEERARGLVLMMCLAVLFFSYSDVILAREPGQFAGLHSRTDAIYFTVSTLATVGFGDIHASGQAARAAVTVQILFNLVFIGAAASVITGMMRGRAQRRLHHHGAGPREGAGPGEGAGPAEGTGPAEGAGPAEGGSPGAGDGGNPGAGDGAGEGGPAPAG